MFRFKMLTKVLVAVLLLGQLIELNVNICIALSIERARPDNRIKLHRGVAWQTQQADPSLGTLDDPETLLGVQSFAASLDETSSTNNDDQMQLRGVQTLESTGRTNYFGEIFVGTPKISFMVLFETSASTLWLPSASCKEDICKSRQHYNSSLSSTFVKDGRRLSISSMNGIEVDTLLDTDTIQFAGITLDNFTFAEATQITGKVFEHLPVDGIFGLSPSNKFNPMDSPLEAIMKRGLIEEPIFSLYLNGEPNGMPYSPQAGELVLGRVDPDHYEGEITYVPVTPTGLWQFQLSGISVRMPYDNETNLETGCDTTCAAIVDTGTALIGGHFADIDRLNRQLGAMPKGDGSYIMTQCDLNLMPDLVLHIGEADFVMKPKDYVVMNIINQQVVSCHSVLRVIDSERFPYWVLGDFFLRRHLVVFDYGNKRIGFAKAKQVEPEPPARRPAKVWM